MPTYSCRGGRLTSISFPDGFEERAEAPAQRPACCGEEVATAGGSAGKDDPIDQTYSLQLLQRIRQSGGADNEGQLKIREARSAPADAVYDRHSVLPSHDMHQLVETAATGGCCRGAKPGTPAIPLLAS